LNSPLEYATKWHINLAGNIMQNDRYTAKDLAVRAGISERTVRFYLEQGLLPAAEGRGRGAHFRESHLTLLKLILAMQQAGNDLDTIREFLTELGPQDAKAAAALRVWESRQERAEMASWYTTFRPGTVYRHRIADGVELLVDSRVAPAKERMKAIVVNLRLEFAED
jgi:Ca-activated chloride channel family protein